MLMSLVDPVEITVAGNVLELPRVSVGQYKSEYLLDDIQNTARNRFTASTAFGKRRRHVARLDTQKLDSIGTSELSSSVYVVIDEPTVGFTHAELRNNYSALSGFLTDTFSASLMKILGGES